MNEIKSTINKIYGDNKVKPSYFDFCIVTYARYNLLYNLRSKMDIANMAYCDTDNIKFRGR